MVFHIGFSTSVDSEDSTSYEICTCEVENPVKKFPCSFSSVSAEWIPVHTEENIWLESYIAYHLHDIHHLSAATSSTSHCYYTQLPAKSASILPSLESFYRSETKNLL